MKMKTKIAISILSLIVAISLTLFLSAPLLLILPLFTLYYAFIDSVIKLIQKKKVKESKQLVFISVCGLAALLSISTIFSDIGYNHLIYIIFCLGTLGLIISLMTFNKKGENKWELPVLQINTT